MVTAPYGYTVHIRRTDTDDRNDGWIPAIGGVDRFTAAAEAEFFACDGWETLVTPTRRPT